MKRRVRGGTYQAKFFLRAFFALVLFCVCLTPAFATTVSLYQSFAGNLNFVTAGGTLRTGDDTNPCAVTTGPVNGTVSGIPSGATIEAAFLYWAGSGTTADTAVTFNGNNVTADRTFSETFNNAGTLFDFFGAFEDVTSFVSGNGTYSFSNLTVDTGTPWCGSSAVLSGWALIVIYSHASEDFRVVNVFDGLQQFRGSSITLTPNNFVIPSSPINGKFAIVSWEGDVGNSAALSGFTEDITFNGTDLTDAANPLQNQFNSTINTYGTGNTLYGVDIDTYNVSSYLSAGQTSASTVYSSGGDLVLLSAEVISVTNTPVSDLAINKSHSSNFSVNTNGTYTLSVTNNGPMATTGTITVTDTLPTGLGYVSATGTGWSCSYSAPDVTCTRTGTLANGATTPNITLTVSVANSAYPSVTNTATVSGPNFDNVSGNNSVSDPTTVLAPDLSTSTKTVNDLNGGEADIGDTLRYTVTITNSSATAPASGVSVSDDIPANTTGFSVVSTPVGSTNSSTGSGTGANGTGLLSVSNISVPVSSSVTIVYDLVIAGSASPGSTIDNLATISVPAGVGADPSTSTVVSPSQVPTTGTKDLYFAIPTAGTQYVQRAVPTAPASTNTVIVNGASASTSFTLNPVLASALTIGAGAQTIPINIACNNTCSTTANRRRNIQVDLQHGSGGTWTTIGTQTQNNIQYGTAGTYILTTFTVNVASNVTVPAGNQVRVLITNTTTNANRRIQIIPLTGGNYSRARISALTVINVDSITAYNATYPGGTVPTAFAQGETAYLRAVVSDPFGNADITSATITITTPNSVVTVNNAAMTSVATTTGTRTYQYAYTIPTSPLGGNWTVAVNSKEGTENTISDDLIDAFPVEQAIPTIVKSSTPISDPANGTTNPKRIPGAVVQYSLLIANTGRSSPNANTLIVTDVVPTNTVMCVSSTCAGGGNPVTFSNGSPSSGLTFTYGSHVTYSNQVGGGAPFTYTPVPDGNGYDAAVTGFRVAPSGTMSASSGTPPHPSFTLGFRVKIN